MKLVPIALFACATALALPATAPLLASSALAQTTPPKDAQTKDAPPPPMPMRGPMRGSMHHDMMMKELDTNKDGVISKEEFEARAAARYKDADTKKDGKVTLEEYKAHMERERERRRAEREAAMFKRLDTNGDGILSAEEFKAGADRMFDRMDRNKDGKLSPDDHKGMHDGKGRGGPDGKWHREGNAGPADDQDDLALYDDQE